MVEAYTLKTKKSKQLYERAKKVLPAGVSYGIRFFEPYPFYTMRAKGSKLYDADGNEYVDFWLGHTALILGHSPPHIIDAVKKQLENGTIYGTSHELEIATAEQVVKMVPCAEMIRFANSGTEANMYAIRLARAYTNRDKIGKIEGGWHGGYDALHVAVKQPFNIPESAGLTQGATQDTIALPYNDLDGALERLDGLKLASITVEPILGSGGCIPAKKEFLKGLREYCDENETLLIFDEVITGFRVAPGGSQEYYGVRPDIAVFGKILGGGFPVGAFCGSKEIMQKLDPNLNKRPTQAFHGGTFAANPVTMAAGLATLNCLENGKIINQLNNLGEETRIALQGIFDEYDLKACVTGASSLLSVHFGEKISSDNSETDRKMLMDYNLQLMADGIFFLPGHSGALSSAHSTQDIKLLLESSEKYARQLC